MLAEGIVLRLNWDRWMSKRAREKYKDESLFVAWVTLRLIAMGETPIEEQNTSLLEVSVPVWEIVLGEGKYRAPVSCKTTKENGFLVKIGHAIVIDLETKLQIKRTNKNNVIRYKDELVWFSSSEGILYSAPPLIESTTSIHSQENHDDSA